MPLDRTSPLEPLKPYELDALNAQFMEKKLIGYGVIGLALVLMLAFVYRRQIASAVYFLVVYASAIGLRMLRRTQGKASSFARDVQSRADR